MSKIPSLEEMLKLYTKKDLWERIQHYIKTIDQLKQQLAEKDKEIEDLRLQIAELNSKITQMEEQDMIFHNQLAIQELEKVKENLKQLEINIDNQAGFSQGYKLELKQKSLYKNVYKTIDQQIKELKGEKDVKD